MAILLTYLRSSLVHRGLTLLQIDRNVVIHFEPTEHISRNTWNRLMLAKCVIRAHSAINTSYASGHENVP